MGVPPLTDHERLLTLARKVHAAADDREAERLAYALHLFTVALDEHLGHELPLLSRLPPADATGLRRGQTRVAAAARVLANAAAHGRTEAADRCSARAEEMLALLVLQSGDERRAVDGVRSW